MFGLGVGEVLLILIVVLLVFGPTKLPELARTMGKAMGEFRKASHELKETFEGEMYKMERETDRAKLQQKAESKILDAEVEEFKGPTIRPPEKPGESISSSAVDLPNNSHG